MAEEFLIAVEVTANTEQFREQVKREIEAAQKGGAAIPVTATTATAPVGATAVTGTTTVTPNPAFAAAAQLAQQKALAPVPYGAGNVVTAGGAFTPGIGFDPNGWKGLHPGGWTAVNAQAAAVQAAGGVGGAGPAGEPDGGMLMAMGPAGRRGLAKVHPHPGGGRGGGRGGRPWFPTGGLMEYAGAAYIARGLGRSFAASVAHDRALRESEGDPRAMVMADIEYRQKFADAWPVIGRAITATREYFTGEEEALQRTLRHAERQDARVEQMKRAQEVQSLYRHGGELARTRGRSAQERLEVRREYRGALSQLKEEQERTETASRLPFVGQRKEAQDKYEATVRGLSQVMAVGGAGGGASPDYIAYQMAQRQAAVAAAAERRDAALAGINRAEADVLANVKKPFDEARKSAADMRDRSLLDITRNIATQEFINIGEQRASRLRARGRPFLAALASQATRMGAESFLSDPENRASTFRLGVQELAEQAIAHAREFGRDFGQRQRALAASHRVNERILARDPLGARIEGIRAERDEEVLRAGRELPWGLRHLRQWGIRREARQREDIETREFGESRAMRMREVKDRADIMGEVAAGREKSARTLDIQREAERAVEASRKSPTGGTVEERREILRGAANEVEAYQRHLRRSMSTGFGQEVAPGSYAPGVSSGQDNQPVIDAINRNTQILTELRNAMVGAN